tara:strand:+ start:5909 stop:7447 length:1539 start_codon:yes stop_codon:yes gene_type:complete
MDMINIIIAIFSFIIGIIVTFFIFKRIDIGKSKIILEDAKKEAESIKKEKILQAKEKFFELKSAHEKSISDKNRNLNKLQNRIKEKENNLNKRLSELNIKEKAVNQHESLLSNKRNLLEKKEKELNENKQKQIEQLEKISHLSVKEAKKSLIDALRDEAKTEALSIVHNIIEESKLTAKQEAKKIVIQTIQRTATENSIDNAVSVFNIESDSIKGKIIGREGRNIRALESATGVDVIVDDTPEAIIISCFDSVRREIARLSLHKLVTDGRIHPARIEEVVKKTKKEIYDEIIEIGKKTIIDLGIHGLHPELIRMVGRMRYRSSYGQNLLQHSRETANLCATMAAELGLDSKLAKRAGLLHDIGKVPDDNSETPHAILGMQLAEKYGEKPEVCNAIGAHHDEIEMNSLISPIIQVCDAISGARPGARRQQLDSYINRIKELEDTALSYPGVIKSYAIQAGRELRVVVESEKVSDLEANKLSFQISEKIQNDMTYPGQVKVTVIRETRSVSFAK